MSKHVVVAESDEVPELVQMLVLYSKNLVRVPSGTVKNPAAVFLASRGSAMSKETSRSILNCVSRMFGFNDYLQMDWSLLTRDLLLKIRETMAEQGKSAATRNSYMSTLRGVAREAFIAKQMPSEEFDLIKVIKNEKFRRSARGRSLEVEEFHKAMMACSADDAAGVRNAAIVGVLFTCGPRRSELVGVDIEDIDFKRAEIRVIGKGDKERTLFVPSFVMSLINDWLRVFGATKGPLFVRIDRWGNVGKDRLVPDSIRSIVTRIAAQAGLEKVSPHDLRRSFATYLLEEDVGIEVVANSMGHVDLNTTRIYDMTADKRSKESTKHFDQLGENIRGNKLDRG